MDLDGRHSTVRTPPIKPAPGFADIKNLALLHQRQDELIGHAIAATLRAISLFPGAVTLNSLCDAGTNKTTHHDHLFIVVPDPSWPSRWSALIWQVMGRQKKGG